MKSVALLSGLLAVSCLRQPPSPATGAPALQPEAHAAAPAVAAPVAVAPAAPTAEGHAGCGAPAGPAPTMAAAGVTRLGEPVTVTATTPLAELFAAPARFANHTIRTEGTVSAVCQARGCWMQIADASRTVHIRMHGHSFFIPRTASGHHAVVQGTVIDPNPAGHCEQEAAEATGQPVARLELDATGVELN